MEPVRRNRCRSCLDKFSRSFTLSCTVIYKWGWVVLVLIFGIGLCSLLLGKVGEHCGWGKLVSLPINSGSFGWGTLEYASLPVLGYSLQLNDLLWIREVRQVLFIFFSLYHCYFSF